MSGTSAHPLDIHAAVDEIEAGLQALGTQERAAKEKAYLKSDLDFLGVTVPKTRKFALGWLREHPELTHDELIALVTAMWERRIHELRSAGVEILAARVDELGPRDIDFLEELLRASKTWALVDAIAPHVVGPLYERHAELGDVLDRWATDDDFWLRRAAMLALLIPLRDGRGDWERFVRYADANLGDNEFFVRKAIGWILRDTSRKRPEMVRDYTAERAARMSGVTFREAIRRLPEEDQEALRVLRERAG